MSLSLINNYDLNAVNCNDKNHENNTVEVLPSKNNKNMLMTFRDMKITKYQVDAPVVIQGSVCVTAHLHNQIHSASGMGMASLSTTSPQDLEMSVNQAKLLALGDAIDNWNYAGFNVSQDDNRGNYTPTSQSGGISPRQRNYLEDMLQRKNLGVSLDELATRKYSKSSDELSHDEASILIDIVKKQQTRT